MLNEDEKEQEKLPKPKTEMPLPDEDLPLPEKELTAGSSKPESTSTVYVNPAASHGDSLRVESESVKEEKPNRSSMILKSFLLGILFVILIVLIGGGSFILGRNSKPDNQQVVQTQVSAPSPTPDQGYYEGDGFNFRYPEDLELNKEESTYSDYIYLKKLGKTYYTLEILNQEEKSLSEVQEIEKQVEYNGNKWTLYKSSEYCDAGSCGDLAQGYYLRVGDVVYILYLDEGSKEEAEKILSTFKFTDSDVLITAPPGANPTGGAMVACTMEAKICPDGVTSVGRTGPKCEFEKCPGE